MSETTLVHAPKAWSKTVNTGTTYANNTISVTGTAISLVIQNTGTQSVNVRLNGDTACTFPLAGNTSICFGANDIHVTMVQFDNTSGGGNATVLVVMGVITWVSSS